MGHSVPGTRYPEALEFDHDREKWEQVLYYYPDLLRKRAATYRAHLYDDRFRCAGATASPARRRHLLSDRDGRARTEDRALGKRRRKISAAVYGGGHGRIQVAVGSDGP